MARRKTVQIRARSAAEVRGIRKGLRAAGLKFEFKKQRNPRRRPATAEKRFEKFASRMRRKYGSNWRVAAGRTTAEKKQQGKLIRLIHG